jgi:hypothetical protein
VRASVVKDVEDSFRGRKPFPTQNVMAAVDFDLRFTYVLDGWEGTTVTSQDFIKFWGIFFCFYWKVLIEISQGFKTFEFIYKLYFKNHFKLPIFHAELL